MRGVLTDPSHPWILVQEHLQVRDLVDHCRQLLPREAISLKQLLQRCRHATSKPRVIWVCMLWALNDAAHACALHGRGQLPCAGSNSHAPCSSSGFKLSSLLLSKFICTTCSQTRSRFHNHNIRSVSARGPMWFSQLASISVGVIAKRSLTRRSRVVATGRNGRPRQAGPTPYRGLELLSVDTCKQALLGRGLFYNCDQVLKP